MNKNKQGGIFIPANRHPWPHELHVARLLADSGHSVEFLPESNIKTADILLDGVEFEIKSPRTSNTNSLEHILKRALKQAPNIILDTSRMKHARDNVTCSFLAKQIKERKRVRRLILITRNGRIIDITKKV